VADRAWSSALDWMLTICEDESLAGSAKISFSAFTLTEGRPLDEGHGSGGGGGGKGRENTGVRLFGSSAFAVDRGSVFTSTKRVTSVNVRGPEPLLARLFELLPEERASEERSFLDVGDFALLELS